jgi:prefoldin subunit 5
MKKQQLHKSIEELRAELEKVEEAEDHVREHIQGLLKEIDGLVDEKGEIPPHRYQQFLERLKESVQYFEASHRSLTSAVSQVINALSGMGI